MPASTAFFQPPRPSNIFSSRHLRNHFLNHPLLPEPINTIFLILALYCQSTMSSKMCQNYSTEMETAINHLVNRHLQDLTLTSLLASVFTDTWLWRAGPLLGVGQREAGELRATEDAKPEQHSRLLPGRAEADPR